ncbi:MAG: autotransporter-associated beta strand repeat-containing protein [Opitutaceae bacterium]
MSHNIANITTICSLLLTTQSLIEAATVTWDGSTNTSWGNATNWSTSSVPTFTDTVVFDGTASRFTVDLGASDREIDDVIIDSATIYTLTGDQTLILDDVSVESGYRHVIEPNIALTTSSSVWDINTGAYLVVSGVISGGGELRKEGGGLLTLNNNMTYTGATLINDGTLAVATTKANGLANSAVTVNSGAIFTLDANGTGNSFNVGSLAGSGITEIDGGHVTFGADGSDTTFSGTLRDTWAGGGGSVTKDGSGTWTLTGTNTYSNTNVNGGTLQIGDGGTTGSITGNVTNNANLTFNRSDDFTFSDVISGTGSVTKTGTGALTFSGANTYSGATLIESGELIISNGNTDALRNSAVTVDAGATLRFDDNTSAFTYDVGSLAGSGTVNVEAGDLEVGFDNSSTTFSGSLIFDAVEGTAELTKQGTGTWTIQGSGYDLGRGVVVQQGDMVIDGASGNFSRIDVNSTNSQLTIQNTTSAAIFSDAENSGDLVVTGGSTEVNISGLSNGTTGSLVTVENGAMLNVSDTYGQGSNSSTVVDQGFLSVDSFASTAEGTISISDPTGGGALTVGGSGTGSSTFAGIIQDHTSGSGSVTKTGTNTIIFEGTNSYTGGTTIEDGTLMTNNLSGDLVLNSGTFSPGASPAHTTITGDYTQESGGTLEIEIGGSTQGGEYDYLDISGTATLAGTVNVSFIDSYTPSGGESFTILSAGTLTNNGYTLTLPTLSESYLEWETDTNGNSITLTVAFTDDLAGWRAKYGLNPDGSDGEIDWSENGLANILYYVFGLGDPNEANVDRSRLPALEAASDFGDYAFSYLQPEGEDSLDLTLATTVDLVTGFVNLDTLGSEYQPVETETTSLGDGYERITQHFDFVSGEAARFYQVVVSISNPAVE